MPQLVSRGRPLFDQVLDLLVATGEITVNDVPKGQEIRRNVSSE